MNPGMLRKDSLRESTWWIYALAFVALLPAMVLRDFTPDNELRYLSIADEALANGNFWTFHHHGEAYADKPPLYLWLVMGGKWMLGVHCMWFVALFSMLPMLATGWAMDRWSRPHLTLSQRQTALLMLFTCGYFPGCGIVVRMDMLMTLWIVLALKTAYDMRYAPSAGKGALLGLFAFLALFTKGPFGVLIPLLGTLSWLAWTRGIKSFFRIWNWSAWLVLLMCCAVWFYNVYAEGGTEYLDNLLFHQTVDRAVDAFHHKRPFYYYFVAVWYVMAPWSVLFLMMGILERRKAFKGDFRRMMFGVFALTIVMLSCVSSKLQVYLLPAIPFTVYWCATLLGSGTYIRAIRWTAVGLLAVIFFCSWIIPKVNPTIGYGTVSNAAKASGAGTVYVTSDVKHGEDIDAYLDVPVIVVAPDSVPDTPGAAVIYKEKETGKINSRILK